MMDVNSVHMLDGILTEAYATSAAIQYTLLTLLLCTLG